MWYARRASVMVYYYNRKSMFGYLGLPRPAPAPTPGRSPGVAALGSGGGTRDPVVCTLPPTAGAPYNFCEIGECWAISSQREILQSASPFYLNAFVI